MSPPEQDRDLETLRDRVRTAGRTTRSSRIEMFVLGSMVVPVFLLLPTCGAHPYEFALALTFSSCIAVLAAAAPFALWYRSFQARLLKERLQQLPKEEQLVLLLPLLEETTADTRKIAKRLIRDLNAGREVTPAAPPPGAGSEVTPEGC